MEQDDKHDRSRKEAGRPLHETKASQSEEPTQVDWIAHPTVNPACHQPPGGVTRSAAGPSP
jgi:hypothetical protein